MWALALLSVISAAAVAKTVPSDFPPCPDTPSAGTLCSLDVASPRIVPTQALVGRQEIHCKQKRYSTMSSSDLQEYWGKHVVPALGGPEMRLYVTDHHHSCLALVLAGRDAGDRLIIVNVTNDLSSSPSLADFWEGALALDKLWLVDDKNRAPMHPNLLPTTLVRLVNDPYRSLVWAVRNNGGYGKVDGVSYQDFEYAQFLRQYGLLPLPNGSDSQQRWTYCQAAPLDDVKCFAQEGELLGKALGTAITLCKSEAAKSLPGWNQGVVDYPDCGNSTDA